jgi:PAS domain S-box-containing protein
MRLKMITTPRPDREGRLIDGRWVAFRERAVAGGGMVTIRTDITERKRVEVALRDSEEKFRAVVDHSPTAIVLKDADGCFLIVNKLWETWFNQGGGETIGRTVHDFFPRQGADAITAHDHRVLESLTPEEQEYELNQPGKPIRIVLSQKFPIMDADGQPLGIASIVTDLTERKQAEDTLRESEERFRAVVDHSPVSIVLKDLEGRYLIANRLWKSWFNISGDEYLNKTIFDFVPREFAEPIDAHDRLALESSVTREQEFRTPYPDGITRDILSQKFPIMGADGTCVSIGIILTDITERKRAEAALRQAKETAEYANRAKTEFLANMSHELRTPLNSIIGFSDLIKDGVFGPVGSPKYEEYAEDINKSGIHLLELIGDILDISKIEIGELDMSEDEMDIGETVKSCLTMLRERSLRAKVPLTSDIPGDLPRLHADPRRVKQILLNLLTNAIKFTPPEGNVVLEAGLDGGGIAIEIRDTGVGIAPEKIPQVLEPFGQGGDVLTRSHEETGLGLSLAKSLTEMHGGTLSIDSKLGKGTTVTIRFPKHRTVASG